ncbi:hypothetical protein Ahy_B01g055939 isoform D [Arachis hypogaea]|uniref:Phosphoribosylaminoimidazole-succinocarboxamide synthase, chloroplastic n=1 Tax=Arachis hypogaea TaxID=3818 RepID=A0A445AXP3_ARAHY|nr:hypothetical protein Ahy_B01g055939 isoform D [Arachis hypogaea]
MSSDSARGLPWCTRTVTMCAKDIGLVDNAAHTPSLVPPIILELAVPLNTGELNPSLSFSRRTAPDAVAGWSFEAQSVPHSANISDSQQWKHSCRARLLPPSRSFVPPSQALLHRRHQLCSSSTPPLTPGPGGWSSGSLSSSPHHTNNLESQLLESLPPLITPTLSSSQSLSVSKVLFLCFVSPASQCVRVRRVRGSASLVIVVASPASLLRCYLSVASPPSLLLCCLSVAGICLIQVRDIYDSGEYLVLVTTDRQSAFDRILASIPFKGQVLNQTSLWWFERTQHITANAVVSTPDPNVTIAKKCSVFPVEFVEAVTGSTDTSLWTVYNKGIRNYCGNALPDGLVKNQKMAANILTPTTKAADHDVPVTLDEIIERGLMTRADYEEVSRKALSLFEYGQCVALEHGLILVDTKYEFGKAEDGSIMLIDEVHTPDSSRYWIANSYLERFQNGLEPENVDKEFLRLWFKNHCNPYEDEVLPEAPEDLICELSWRYIFLYETITKSKFEVLSSEVLNQTSLWWFERTQHITANAVVSTPDPNVTIAKKYSVFPVEFVARGFVIGSTDTSLWTVYNKGIRNYCGNALPDGLVKNQKLAENILTPTTKAADHDVPVTPDEIIERGLMTRADYEEVSKKALSLFEYGQCVASEHGLILVDTKYEFGKAEDGSIMLTDEVHTPDPSRYWIANSYLERFQNGLEPENVDKEFLRLWFKNHCNPYEDESAFDRVLASIPFKGQRVYDRKYYTSLWTVYNKGIWNYCGNVLPDDSEIKIALSPSEYLERNIELKNPTLNLLRYPATIPLQSSNLSPNSSLRVEGAVAAGRNRLWCRRRLWNCPLLVVSLLSPSHEGLQLCVALVVVRSHCALSFSALRSHRFSLSVRAQRPSSSSLWLSLSELKSVAVTSYSSIAATFLPPKPPFSLDSEVRTMLLRK